MAEFQIRDLQHHDGEDGRHYHTARIVMGGRSFDVDDYNGSWQRPLPEGYRRDLRPDLAEALQAKLPARERKVRGRVGVRNGQ